MSYLEIGSAAVEPVEREGFWGLRTFRVVSAGSGVVPERLKLGAIETPHGATVTLVMFRQFVGATWTTASGYNADLLAINEDHEDNVLSLSGGSPDSIDALIQNTATYPLEAPVYFNTQETGVARVLPGTYDLVIDRS